MGNVTYHHESVQTCDLCGSTLCMPKTPDMLTCMKFELPGHLMHQNRMVGWCTLFLTIVGKEAPVHALDEDYEERERNHFWKSKKWAYANLNRLFVRYVLRIQWLDLVNRRLLNCPKIWQPQHQPEKCLSRNGRIL